MNNNPEPGSDPQQPFSIAALTFTYNESVNLPLWLKHYGAICGEQNLYVADRGSDDNSLASIGRANLLRLPRNEFDEFEKTNFINHLHAAFLNFYDAVIYTDCDELLVADPEKYSGLRQYIEGMRDNHVRAIGVDVLQIREEEGALDLTRPILQQRHFGRFGSPSCKALIAKAPIQWLPGFHSCDHRVKIDRDLVLFHLKFVDYEIACARQMINVGTVWSQRSLDGQFGEHHRWNMDKFVHHGFLVPSDVRRKNGFADFQFEEEIAAFETNTAEANKFFYIPMNVYKWVRIPEKYRSSI